MKKRKIITIVFIIILFIYCTAGVNTAPIENIAIASVIGYDLEKDTNKDILYKIYLQTYIFGERNKVFNKTYSGTATSLIKSREERQLKLDKKFLVGLEKVDLISEAYAKHGISTIIDALFKIPFVNDTALVAICEDNISDLLDYKIEGYPTSGDYIEGMLKNANQYNFFAKDLKILDLFISLGIEGRSVKIPCIELSEKVPKITGECLFKNDKMVFKLDMKDSRLLNILSTNNSTGILTLQEDPGKFIDYYAKVRRKVSCSKVNDVYNFTITLHLKGDIISNELYKDIMKDPKTVAAFEKNMADDIKANCNEFISKMKNQYKLDCLDLGRVATAKYGKDTGADWDKIVPNSNIKVNVYVKVDNQGRGDY
ncbi:Ger(x)C family spore germination protein [Clostridium sp. A1-XYC3]|uniref:Ger(X)C family spore germination protein n=1 Tax=Clostridium tanneri TaxID=3037988 RepID=A0ABU4JXC8_9CLOT|nr:Ger(x)C family spore germination protein [Clostridium sp. A1-XYC3]MDW8802813.1 Ger(x)C family spore germination protein [Clostridium sp. A1-XYC3]